MTGEEASKKRSSSCSRDSGDAKEATTPKKPRTL